MSLNQQIDAHILHSGWLYKKGWYNTSWKKRYFVLYDDRTIHYFAKKSHASNRSKAKGKIHLTQIRRVELVQYIDPQNKSRNKKPSNTVHANIVHRKSSLPLNLSPIALDDDYKHDSHHRHLSLSDPGNIIIDSSLLNAFSSSTPNGTTTTKRRNAEIHDNNNNTSTRPDMRSNHSGTSSPNSRFGQLSPLQSIDERESIEAVTSLQPFGGTNNNLQCVSPLKNGVNGWSFQNPGILIDDYFYSQPSPVVSSTQPPPDYHQILEKEKREKRRSEELAKSLASLASLSESNSYDDSKLKSLRAKQQQISPRPKVTISRRTGRKARTLSAGSAEIEKDLASLNRAASSSSSSSSSSASLSSLETPVPITHRRQRSQSLIHPLLLQSSSTTIINETKTDNLLSPPPHPRIFDVNSNISATATSSQCSQSGDPEDQSLTELDVISVGCELDDDDDDEKIAEFSLNISSNFHETSCSTSNPDILSIMSLRGRYGVVNNHKNMIVSSKIKQHHKSSYISTTDDGYDMYDLSESKKDEFDVFQTVMDDTRLGLTCNRRYSFSLIHPNREYILSAETNEELKEWITIFSRLAQGKPIYSGYLALKDAKKDKIWSKKFFILFENKVLNYYKDVNDVSNACEFDIDLRHVIWVRYCHKNEFNQIDMKQFFHSNDHDHHHRHHKQITNAAHSSLYVPTNTAMYFSSRSRKKHRSAKAIMHESASAGSLHPHKHHKNGKKKHQSNSIYSLEIAIPNRLFIMTAETQRIRNEWYNRIRSVFADTLILKRYYDSSVINIKIVHNGQHFKNRYIALFEKIGLVLFQDKQKLSKIKRMTFFDELRFRDYIKKENCTIITINENVKVRRESTQNGDFAFVVSNAQDERTWIFNVETEDILDRWIYLLVDKRRQKQGKQRKSSTGSCAQIQNMDRLKVGHLQKRKPKSKSVDFVVGSNSLSNTQKDKTSTSLNVNHLHVDNTKKVVDLRDDTSNSLLSASYHEEPISDTDFSLQQQQTQSPISPIYVSSNTTHNPSNTSYPTAAKFGELPVIYSQKRQPHPLLTAQRSSGNEKAQRCNSEGFVDEFEVVRSSDEQQKKYVSRAEKKKRCISADGQDLSPRSNNKGKSKRYAPANVDLDKMFQKQF